MNCVRILNLEPSEDESRRLRTALDKCFDLEWRRAQNEKEFRELLSAYDWDVVVAGDTCRCFSALDAYEVVEDAETDIPFIITVEQFDQGSALEAIRLGVNDYIAKGETERLTASITRELLQAEGRREKRAAEKALAESEDRLRTALRSAGIGAWELDLKTDDTVWSPEASTILGIPVAGSKASVLRDMIIPEDLAGLEAQRSSVISNRRGFSTKVRIRRRGGDIRWIAVSGKCEYDNLNAPVRLVGTVRDITGDQKAEEALRRSESNFRALVQATTEYVWQLDERANLTEFPQWWVDLTGQSYDESLKYGWVQCLHPDDRERVKDCYVTALETGKAVSLELRIRSKAGEYRHYYANGVPMTDDSGLRRWICALSDITDQRSVEDQYKLISSMSADYMFSATVNADGSTKMDWVAGALEAITGRGEEFFRAGGTWRSIIHPDDVAQEDADAAAVFEGRQVESELRIVRPEGEITWVRRLARPVWDKEEERVIKVVGSVKDVTDKKTAELAVREHDEYLRTVLNAVPQCVKVFSPEAEILDMNPAGLEIIEADSIDDVRGKHPYSVLSKSDIPEFKRALKEAMGGKTVTVSYGMRGFKGTSRQMEMAAAPIKDATGKITAVLGVSRDVTERLRSEEDLKRSEALMGSVFNQSALGVKLADAAGRFIGVNARLCEIYGYTFEEIRQASIGDLTHADDLAMEAAIMEKVVAGNVSNYNYEKRALRKNGEVFWVNVSGGVVRNPDGSIDYFVSIVDDITNRKGIEVELRHSKAMYADLINTVDGIVWEVDAASMQFTFVSKQAETILGYPVHDWYEAGFWENHIHEDDRDHAISYCAEETARGEGHTFEYRMIAADGRVVWLRDIVSVVQAESGEPMLLRGLMVDVTEQRRLDAAVKQKAKLIDQTHEAIFVWRLEEGIVEWSKGCEELFGYTAEEAVGRQCVDILFTQFPRPQEEIAQILETEGSFTCELIHTSKDGRKIYSETRYQRFEMDGKVLMLQTNRDVTASREAEIALRKSETRYRHLFENSPYPMWAYDVESLDFLAVNDAAVVRYGYSREEFARMKLTDIRPPEERDRLMDQAKMTLHRIDSSGNWRHRTKDGSIINVEITSHALDWEGRPARLVLANDITERLRAQEALKRSESKYRELVSNANDIIYTHDLQGRFTSLNHAGERVTGYTEEEAKKLTLADCVAPEFMLQAKAMMEKKVASGTTTIYETELIVKDGRRIPLEINSRLIYEDGKPVAVQGIARDFTERRRAEEELRQQRERLDKTAEAAPVMICSFRIGTDGRKSFPFTSPASTNVFGFSPEELAVSADPVFERIQPEFVPDIASVMGAAGEDPSPVRVVYEYDHPEKGMIWVETHAAPTFDKDGSQIWHGIVTDITKQKKAEAALIASEEQLRQSQKLESIGILAGGLAHDFNNMLTAINGYSDLILRKVPQDNPVRKHVEEIKKAGERSAELTRQLLAFSRRQILQPTKLDLNNVIADTASMMKRLIGEDISVTTNFAPNLWNIQADQGQLTQVVMNLMINARDAMPEGGSVLIETANVELDADYAGKHLAVAPGRYVMMAISDTGIGMDEATRKRVFEPFFTTKPVGRGTGLGLSTVYGIVKQSGGNIWVYSEPGKGSTFKIYLPEVAGANENARTAIEQKQPQVGSEKILLVEDEHTVRGLAREILESCGYQVFEASNGVEAYTRFENESQQIDLLITDIVMPEMGGRELSEWVLKRCPHIKVLFTSGYTDDAIIRHGIIDEGKNFLQKPFTFDGLARKVRAVLDESPKELNKAALSKN